MGEPATVYYFTRSFPFGLGEEWKAVELRSLRSRFARVVVVPYSFAGQRVARTVPSGIEVMAPLFDDDPTTSRRRAISKVLRSKRRMYFMNEFVRAGVWRHRSWFSSWLAASSAIEDLLQCESLQSVLRGLAPNDLLVFFWGRGACDILPLLSRPQASVVKMHRYDLFIAVNDGYIPYRRTLMCAAGAVLPTSLAGEQELRTLYPEHSRKVRRAALGASEVSPAFPSSDGVFRILTCSLVSPVKRLDLLLEALRLVPFPVEWTHVGDGPQFRELQAAASTLPSNVTTSFLGWIAPTTLHRVYAAGPIDLFVNVSSSEGVPISVQEALSAGVPVLATDVGGTADVIDSTVGRLISARISPDELAAELAAFRDLSPDEVNKMRRAARRRWETDCDAGRLADLFTEFAASLVSGQLTRNPSL